MILLTRCIPRVPRQQRRDLERQTIASLLREHFGRGCEWAYTSEGKPYLPEFPECYISISHTDGLLALLLALEPIGLDVEHYSPRLLEVCPRILSPETWGLIKDRPIAERSELCLLAWTASEALFKLHDKSQLISDFEYVADSLRCLGRSGHYRLQSYYRDRPDIPLEVEARMQGGYMITWARYALKK